MPDTPLVAADYQQLILAELGLSSTSTFAAHIDLFWRRHRARGAVSIDLQYLYTKLSALDFLRGQNYRKVDWKGGGVEQSDEQISLNLQRIRDDVEMEIRTLTKQLGLSAAPLVGQITTTAPVMPTGGCVDPNDSVFRGDPRKRNRFL